MTLDVAVIDCPGHAEVSSSAIETADGPTCTFTGDVASTQPFANVSTTEYVPDADTVIDCVVAPLDHAYDCAGAAVSVTLLPAQNVVGPLASIDAAFSVTTDDALALQPFVVAVTLYVPSCVTVIDAVVAPVDQRYESAPLAVSVVDPPGQSDVVPLMTGCGSGLKVMVTELVDEQPFAFVAVSVYVPDAVTSMCGPFWPVDHAYVHVGSSVVAVRPDVPLPQNSYDDWPSVVPLT